MFSNERDLLRGKTGLPASEDLEAYDKLVGVLGRESEDLSIESGPAVDVICKP